jgi:hypothetical protein
MLRYAENARESLKQNAKNQKLAEMLSSKTNVPALGTKYSKIVIRPPIFIYLLSLDRSCPSSRHNRLLRVAYQELKAGIPLLAFSQECCVCEDASGCVAIR